ncbi:hypothetical protein QVD99_001736 [Batrachochytrium dendrobatidis]|nr:hypothetical protein O5D80_000383 [Batrachochytrium dendrobatidis]KAK5671910.1 hypothetical protein QVD99_001736 [Batrachochytrium dendrobatidis]
MAGGTPFEIFNIFGAKLPRYQVVAIVIGIYATGITGLVQYNKFKATPPIKFDSVDEEDFVKKYIHHHHEEFKKPALLRSPFSLNAHH